MIEYTKEQKDLARSSNIVDVLNRLGETVSMDYIISIAISIN